MAEFRQTFILFMFMRLVVGDPISRLSSENLLTGSCSFDSDLCGYTPISGQPATWVQIITKDPLHGIPPTTDGNYAYFKSNSINIHNGDTRSLVSPKLNINGCNDLEFYYILPYTDTMTLSIKLQESGKITLVKDITGMNMNKWLYTKINNICVTKNTQLIFETTKLSFYAYVGIDNIKVTLSKLVKPSTTPTTNPTTSKPTTEPKQITSKPTSTKSPTTKQPTTARLPSTTARKRSNCFSTEVEKLWYMKDMERLELEKQKLHNEIKSNTERFELEKQKLHLEIKILKEKLGQK
ncbi:hypothetical protein LOTGIDRAFT_158012 [Lottia gigantea]|uniref:MAM domain-containing protein n=1 Tax=Lottia gigantea TaxID=225164 RepID=V4ATT5_LOTGI|nr:hypothetical protein LOTGIDRAFT_158012 [Lottia gigantea]ESP00718.1 hypothetical protein LOTGIDRAFT_158012 [Lottia gigantea]